MQLADFIVFEFVASRQLRYLLIKKRDIRFILISNWLLLVREFIQSLLHDAHLIAATISSQWQPLLEVVDSPLSILHDQVQLLSPSLELLTLVIHFVIFLYHQLL